MPLLVTLFVALMAVGAYAVGRLHQWYRRALERDDAWRDGYDRASGTMFALAARVTRRRPGENTGEIAARKRDATVTDIADAPSAGRHSFELRTAATRRLTISTPDDERAV
jgi:hypothetical protein